MIYRILLFHLLSGRKVRVRCGTGSAGCFVWHEAKLIHPLMDVRQFSRNVIFAFSNLAALINYSATFALGFLLSLYLQIVRGFDSQFAGLILLSQPVLMASLSPFAGRLSDKLEPRIVASWGMGLTALGLLALAFINETTSVWIIVLFLILIGIGFALFLRPTPTPSWVPWKGKFTGWPPRPWAPWPAGQVKSHGHSHVVIDLIWAMSN